MFALKHRGSVKPSAPVQREPIAADSQTYFEATAAPLARRPTFTGARRCDVCIVGAGIFGLSAALHLSARGYDVVVLEAGWIGAGASGRNSGFVLPGYAAETDEVVELAEAARLWQLSADAVALVKALAARHAIDCDLKHGALTAAAAPSDMAALTRQAKLMRRFGYAHAELLGRDELRAIVDAPHYHGGVFDSGAAHLHPLNFVRGLARAALAEGAVIFEESPVLRVDRDDRPKAWTARGCVEADHLVLAANALLGGLAPDIARRILPITAYLGATEPLGCDLARQLLRRDVAVYDTRPALDYYRLTPDHRLIFGCAPAFVAPTPDRAGSWLARRAARVFAALADVRMAFSWHGQIDLTRNRLPDIGRRDRLWHAQGFNGHGVALATLTGRAVADAIAGDDEDFGVLSRLPYSPWPGGLSVARAALPFVRGAWQLKHALGHYIGGLT